MWGRLLPRQLRVRSACSQTGTSCQQALLSMQNELVHKLRPPRRANYIASTTVSQSKVCWDCGEYPRILTDHVASAEECRLVAHSTRVALSSGITQAFEMHSETRMFPCEGEYSEEMLGPVVYAKVQQLVGRIQRHIESDYRTKVSTAGALLQWRRGSGDDIASEIYSTSHVDKANRVKYDISAVLYLTTEGDDFTGGAFAFNDEDGDQIVTPIAGRLLTFSSGAWRTCVHECAEGYDAE